MSNTQSDIDMSDSDEEPITVKGFAEELAVLMMSDIVLVNDILYHLGLRDENTDFHMLFSFEESNQAAFET